MSDPNELEQLRAELATVEAAQEIYLRDYRGCDHMAMVGVMKSRIAKLEAEAADPWRSAKSIVGGIEKGKDCLRPAQVEHARYTRHLEAENAAKAARIAELGRTAQEWGRAANHRSESSLIVPDDLRARIDVYEERIAELESRPVPPLDPLTTFATACKAMAKSDPLTASFVMQVFRAGNAGIYPLVGMTPHDPQRIRSTDSGQHDRNGGDTGGATCGRVDQGEGEAMTIKPEDVPQDLLELAMERFEGAYWNDVTPVQVADFLQDAIDSGVVSPPCWIARTSNGQLVSGTVYPSRDDAERYKWTSDNFEHWKGQTE